MYRGFDSMYGLPSDVVAVNVMSNIPGFSNKIKGFNPRNSKNWSKRISR